jgi:hypothetical protein
MSSCLICTLRYTCNSNKKVVQEIGRRDLAGKGIEFGDIEDSDERVIIGGVEFLELRLGTQGSSNTQK